MQGPHDKSAQKECLSHILKNYVISLIFFVLHEINALMSDSLKASMVAPFADIRSPSPPTALEYSALPRQIFFLRLLLYIIFIFECVR